MNYTIRQATLADLPVLLRFEQGVIGTERRFDPTIRDGLVHYYDIAGMLAAENVHFLVAECGADVVGCGYARIDHSEHFLRHPVHGYLGFMYVDPGHRGRGIIGLVINALVEWCRAQGLTEFRLEVYSENQAAVSAYARAGFTSHMLEMRMSVSPPR